MPEEVRAARDRVRGGPTPSVAPLAVAPAPAPADAPAPAPETASDKKVDAREAFKTMLTECGCQSNMTWEQALRLVINDRRYQGVPSVTERKNIFLDWTRWKAVQDKDDARRRFERAREDFRDMLEGCSEILSTTKFSRARDVLERDPRWRAIESGREREELFSEYLERRDRKERAERAREREDKRAALKELFRAQDWIVPGTEWKRLCGRLEGQPAFEQCPKLDRLEVFAEWLRSLEVRERELKEQERSERLRTERKRREDFAALLRRLADEGAVTCRMRWRECLPHVEHEEAYRALCLNTGGSRPKELFLDLVDDLEAAWDRDVSVIMRTCAVCDVVMDAETTYEAFRTSLSAGLDDKIESAAPDAKDALRVLRDKLDAIPDASTRLCFEELIGKMREKEARRGKGSGKRRTRSRSRERSAAAKRTRGSPAAAPTVHVNGGGGSGGGAEEGEI